MFYESPLHYRNTLFKVVFTNQNIKIQTDHDHEELLEFLFYHSDFDHVENPFGFYLVQYAKSENFDIDVFLNALSRIEEIAKDFVIKCDGVYALEHDSLALQVLIDLGVAPKMAVFK